MNHESTIIVRIGLYSALCVVIGFLFVPLPNIELITLFVFLGGYLYGVSNGLIIGVFSEFIYSAFNPWGSGLAFPPMLIGQVISYGIIGMAGGIASRAFNSSVITAKRMYLFGFCGGFLTLMFAIILAFLTGTASGFSLRHMAVLFAAGIPWKAWHIASNSILFATLLPILIRAATTLYQTKETT